MDLIEMIQKSSHPAVQKHTPSQEFFQKKKEQVAKYGFYTLMEFKQDIALSCHYEALNEIQGNNEFILHNHDFFEILYVYRGNCINFFRNSSIQLNTGDVLLLNPNSVHAPYSPTENDIIINILIKKNVFYNIIHSLIHDNQLFSNFVVNYMYQINKTTDFLYFPYQKQYPVNRSIIALAEEYYHQDLYYANAMQADLISLFVTLSRIYKTIHQDKINNPATNQLIVQILSYINQNIATISLQELSKQFQYSTSYLSKLIQKHTGKKFSDIIRYLKLETSCGYLKNKSLSMQQIVELVGFNDVSYFFKVFKKQYGMTPSMYRKL